MPQRSVSWTTSSSPPLPAEMPQPPAETQPPTETQPLAPPSTASGRNLRHALFDAYVDLYTVAIALQNSTKTLKEVLDVMHEKANPLKNVALPVNCRCPLKRPSLLAGPAGDQ